MRAKLIKHGEQRIWKSRKIICAILLLTFITSLSCFTYLTFVESLSSLLIMLSRCQGYKPYVVVCYYNLPSDSNDVQSLQPQNIDPQICTHIIVGFAEILNNSISLESDISMYQKVVDLKKENPNLKVMISIGGAGEEVSKQFRNMTQNHAKRKVFIQSVLKVINLLNLDGIDIDWEYPSWLHSDEEYERNNKTFMNLKLGDEREKIHFVQLVQELRKAFDRSGRQLTLSVAVGAPKAIVDQSYNVPQIAEHVDFINLMSYDYHFYISYFPVTDLNSPLYGNNLEQGYLTNLNVNFSANYWNESGMPREKIVVGIPTYGHSYTLFNALNHKLHSPAKDFGKLGDNGFVNYSTICNFLLNEAAEVFVTDSRVPYAYKDTEWISYDNIMSVTFKALWIKENDFLGAMVYCLNSDDWIKSCWVNQSFPLIRSINYVLNNE